MQAVRYTWSAHLTDPHNATLHICIARLTLVSYGQIKNHIPNRHTLVLSHLKTGAMTKLTLMRRMRSVNFLFMLKLSVLLTVLLAGDLFKILYLAQLRE